MKSTRKSRTPIPPESIASLADRGKDVSRFFTNTGRMKMPGPIRKAGTLAAAYSSRRAR
jgi:hypothetical protein